MQILHHHHLHSLSSLNYIPPLSLLPKLSSLSLRRPTTNITTTIRMGGRRVYPGGVTKGKWRVLRTLKAEKLLKEGLAREPHIYKMRKKAELEAASAFLERPWDGVVNGGRQLEEGDGSEEESRGVDDGSLDGVGSRNRRGSRNGIRRNSSRGSQSGRLGVVKFASDTEESDGEDPFDSSVNLDSRVGDGVWNGPNVRSLTRGKQRGGFRHSGHADGSLNGGGSRNKRGGRNGMNLRSQTRGGKLGNGSIAREIDKSGHENSDFSGLKPSYGGRNERYHGVVNNHRGGGTRIDGNGPKLKDLGGRQTSSNTRHNGRQWSSRGWNTERFGRSHSQDVCDMSLLRDGSCGFSARDE